MTPVSIHFQTIAPTVRLRLHLETSDPALLGFDVYVNRVHVGRVESFTSPNPAAQPTPHPSGLWGNGQGPGTTDPPLLERSSEWLRIASGLRSGFNQLRLIPWYPDTHVEAAGSLHRFEGWGELGRSRTFDLDQFVSGGEAISELTSRQFRVLAELDRTLRNRDRQPFELHPGSEIHDLFDLIARTREDAGALYMMSELDRLYFLRWHEPLRVDLYLDKQQDDLAELQAQWRDHWPMMVAADAYRNNPSKRTLEGVLTDLTLGLANLRNAYASLRMRGRRTTLEGLTSVGLLTRQNLTLAQSLLTRLELVMAGVESRRKAMEKETPKWRKEFGSTFRAILASLKNVPPEYPSDTVLNNETKALTLFFEVIRKRVRLEINFMEISLEMIRGMTDPTVARQGPLPPRRQW